MIRLNQQQLNFFDTFGYLALPGLMADCIDEIIDAFEQVWAERGGGHDGQPHDGERRSCIVPFIDQPRASCAPCSTTRASRACSPACSATDFNYSSSDGNYYAGDNPVALRRLSKGSAPRQNRLLPRSLDAGYRLPARDPR